MHANAIRSTIFGGASRCDRVKIISVIYAELLADWRFTLVYRVLYVHLFVVTERSMFHIITAARGVGVESSLHQIDLGESMFSLLIYRLIPARGSFVGDHCSIVTNNARGCDKWG